MRLWPRSLLGRTVVVLLTAVLASNAVGIAVYSGERRDALTSARSRQIAEQVAAAAAAIESAPAAERRHLLRSVRRPGLRLAWSQQPAAEDDLSGWRARLIREAFRAELGDVGLQRLRLSSSPFSPSMAAARQPAGEAAGDDLHPPGPPPQAPAAHPPRWHQQHPGPGGPELRLLIGALHLQDGSWLNFSAPIATFPPFWATPLFFVLIVSTALVTAASVWAVRRATQPLALFAAAAERLGRDVDAPPLETGGPLEVERAAVAFNRMQQRLQAFVRERTHLLAAISHDLRTPLTRLRLRAELIEDREQQKKTIADLDEMQAMLQAALSFARDDAAAERPQPLDLALLLRRICEAAGPAASYDGPPEQPFFGRRGALRRAFANLVDNAIAYGERARVSLAAAPGELRVSVEDDGPGVPDAERQRLFEPFYRLEGSRNRETGGVGLGLALVRAAVLAHGGRVELTNRPEGGLRAEVILPLPAGG